MRRKKLEPATAAGAPSLGRWIPHDRRQMRKKVPTVKPRPRIPSISARLRSEVEAKLDRALALLSHPIVVRHLRAIAPGTRDAVLRRCQWLSDTLHS